MQINKVSDNYQLNFSAEISKNFICASGNYCKKSKKDKRTIAKFFQKVHNFETYGYDNYTIKYKRNNTDGKTRFSLVALKPGMKNSEGAILAEKSTFRELFDKFLHINRYEFSKKMEEKLHKNFAAKTWSEFF